MLLGLVGALADGVGAVELVVVVVVLEDDALAVAHVVALLLVVDARQDVPDRLEGARLHQADHQAALVLVRADRLLRRQELRRVVVDQLDQLAVLHGRLLLHVEESLVQFFLNLGPLFVQLDFRTQFVDQTFHVVRIRDFVLFEQVLDVDGLRLQTAILGVHFVEVLLLFLEFFPHFLVQFRYDLEYHVVHVGYWFRVVSFLIVDFVICEALRHKILFVLVADID